MVPVSVWNPLFHPPFPSSTPPPQQVIVNYDMATEAGRAAFAREASQGSGDGLTTVNEAAGWGGAGGSKAKVGQWGDEGNSIQVWGL